MIGNSHKQKIKKKAHIFSVINIEFCINLNSNFVSHHFSLVHAALEALVESMQSNQDLAVPRLNLLSLNHIHYDYNQLKLHLPPAKIIVLTNQIARWPKWIPREIHFEQMTSKLSFQKFLTSTSHLILCNYTKVEHLFDKQRHRLAIHDLVRQIQSFV